jgi:hypothetical protein
VNETTGGDVCSVAEEKAGDKCQPGSEGTEPGKFKGPAGIAVNNETHNVYVVDRGNDRVQEFNEQGQYLAEFNGSGLNLNEGIDKPPAPLENPEAIAIDNDPSSPSHGDVYVEDIGHQAIDKFTSTGEYKSQITIGAEGARFTELRGVAVDTQGELWVSQNGVAGFNGTIDNYSDEQPNVFAESRNWNGAGPIPGFAVDSEDNLYTRIEGGGPGSQIFLRFNRLGERNGGNGDFFGGEKSPETGIAVDPSNNNVYIDVDAPEGNRGHGVEPADTAVEEFTATESPIESFGSAQLSDEGGEDLAVDASNQTVYVADGSDDAVKVYSTVPRPDVLATAPTDLHTEGSATLTGTVDPDGLPLTECKFEYVPDAVFKEPTATQEPPANEVQTITSTEHTKHFYIEFPPGSGEAVYVEANASHEEVQSALEELPAFEELPSFAGNIAVSGEEGGPYTVEFINELAHTKVPKLHPEEGYVTAAITTEGAKGGDGSWETAVSKSCEQGLGKGPGEIGTGTLPVLVSLNITGLTPDTLYDYRLAATNKNGKEEELGEPHRFVAPAHPGVSGEHASAVESSTATLQAQVDPGGAATSYYVEYATTAEAACFEEKTCPKTSPQPVGTSLEAIGVQVQLSGLHSGTEYRYRFVAVNEVGAEAGAGVTLTTTAAAGPSSSALPDNRVYELVTPPIPGSDTDVFVPCSGGPFTTTAALYGIPTCLPFQVAPDGDALAYVGDPPPTGGNGALIEGRGNQFLARRSAGGGWSSEDIQPVGLESAMYNAFSNDLSASVLSSAEPLAEGVLPEHTADLYAHATAGGAGGAYAPLVTGLSPVTNFAQFPGATNRAEGPYYAGANAGVAGVPASSHQLFEAANALPSTPQALAGDAVDNLYDSFGGHLYSVNVLPASEGGAPDPNATFGSPKPADEGSYRDLGLTNVISADGSRIFWTSLETVEEEELQNGLPDGKFKLIYRPKALYVRENDTSPGASTVLVAAGGEPKFWTANSEGSLVFYTKEAATGDDLYEFNVETGQTTDLSVALNPAEPAEVQGVLGASENGEYVYFAAKGVLTGKNAEEKTPTSGQPNIYLSHDGKTTFVSTGEGGEGVSPEPDLTGDSEGDWHLNAALRTAEVTSDGALVFMSNADLTGYDSELTELNPLTKQDQELALDEVYLYEASSAALRCVSCNPTGAAPVPTPKIEGPLVKSTVGAFVPFNQVSTTYQTPWVSDGGARVFFDSPQPLVSSHTSGYLGVYEWERAGTEGGTCPASAPGGGCIYLLSSPTDKENSYLIGPDASGDNVFFVTRADLNAQDRGDDDVIYDARVNGYQPPAEEKCSGTACQGVPPAPPIFATPASVTFSGTGNYPPPPPTKPKVETKSEKLAKALKVCHKDKKKAKRQKCEKAAKKKYSAKASKAKKSTHTNRRTPR